MRYLFLLCLLTGCGFFKKHEATEPKANDRVSELRLKVAAKRAELAPLLDGDGYPLSSRDCDLTLWAGKACAAGVAVKIALVEYAPGQIHRRPAPSCWEGGDKGAASTVSNDMLMGYLACLWATKDLVALNRLADYGEAHEVSVPIPGWQMGEPYPAMASRVVMRPNGIGLVGRMIEALTGGTVTKGYRSYPAVFGPVTSDFERHLQAEGIYLHGDVNAVLLAQGTVPVEAKPDFANLVEINDVEFKRLQALTEVEPSNPLFHAVLGIYTRDETKAIDLLLDDATPVPSYVRGAAQKEYELIHWLRAAQIVLDRFRGE
jgi:hypothetical protein